MKIKGTAPPASSANRGWHGTWSRGSTQMKNTLARRRAFTLIELMTVVVIVGVLAAVSLVGARADERSNGNRRSLGRKRRV